MKPSSTPARTRRWKVSRLAFWSYHPPCPYRRISRRLCTCVVLRLIQDSALRRRPRILATPQSSECRPHTQCSSSVRRTNWQNSSLLILDELEIQPFTENHR